MIAAQMIRWAVERSRRRPELLERYPELPVWETRGVDLSPTVEQFAQDARVAPEVLLQEAPPPPLYPILQFGEFRSPPSAAYETTTATIRRWQERRGYPPPHIRSLIGASDLSLAAIYQRWNELALPNRAETERGFIDECVRRLRRVGIGVFSSSWVPMHVDDTGVVGVAWELNPVEREEMALIVYVHPAAPAIFYYGGDFDWRREFKVLVLGLTHIFWAVSAAYTRAAVFEGTNETRFRLTAQYLMSELGVVCDVL